MKQLLLARCDKSLVSVDRNFPLTSRLSGLKTVLNQYTCVKDIEETLCGHNDDFEG